jgi:hypothetical protein
VAETTADPLAALLARVCVRTPELTSDHDDSDCGLDGDLCTGHAAGRLEAAVAAVLALADRAEHGAIRWEDPLPVPPWVGELRSAISAALLGQQEGGGNG